MNQLNHVRKNVQLQADSEDLDKKINETFSDLENGERIPVFADVDGALQEL